MKKILILNVLFCLYLGSCTESEGSIEKNGSEPQVVEQKKSMPEYKSLPISYTSELLNNADVIEGSFYEGGKSISLSRKNVKGVLSMMSDAPPKTLDAKLLGHLMYLQNGQSLAFVELYLSENNNYLKYKMKGEYYYNVLNENGVKFLGGLAAPPGPQVKQ